MRKEEKDKTINKNESYEEFYKLYNVFTLSFAKRHIECRKQAEQLIRELIHYSLADSNKSNGWVEFEINTDLKERPTGFHIGFTKELPEKLYRKLIKNLRVCGERWRLGGREQWLVERIREASEYFWKNTGVPSRHRFRVRRSSKSRLTSALRQLEQSLTATCPNLNKQHRQWESCMLKAYNNKTKSKEQKEELGKRKVGMNNYTGVLINESKREKHNKKHCSTSTPMGRDRATC